jgi:hypothetical protein
MFFPRFDDAGQFRDHSSDTALPRSGWFKVIRRIGPSCLVRMSVMPLLN